MRILLKALCLILLCAAPSPLSAQSATIANPSAPGAWVNAPGRLVSYRQFPSKFVEPREVDVWLPPGYDAAAPHRYPVIYMHDGQNLFDPDLSSWHKTWQMDTAMLRLIAAHRVPPAIVVGVWNTPHRTADYMPQKAAAMAGVTDAAKISGMPGPSTGIIDSDAYLAFLVHELKPFIDAHYRTQPGLHTTSVMGSSMGGLISLYAIVEYPQVFGQAACLSTHWPASDGVVIDYVKSRLPYPATHRLYFDFGTTTLDAQYQPFQTRMDAALRARGYVEGRNWITLKFPGAEHSETSWSARVDLPLQVLLTGHLPADDAYDASIPEHLVP